VCTHICHADPPPSLPLMQVPGLVRHHGAAAPDWCRAAGV
jgi:hypothetical protein